MQDADAHTSMASASPHRIRLLAKLFVILSATVTAAFRAPAQQLTSPIGAAVPHRYLVAYRNNTLTGVAESFVRIPGVQVLRRHPVFGIAIVQTDAHNEAATIARLRSDPEVEFVIHDRILAADNLILRSAHPAISGVVGGTPTTPTLPTAPAPYDTYYRSAQGWAVIQSGGYGAGVPGGPARGPWDTTLGAGVRIAILDSGVDQSHPDIAPNLAFNLSEIDQSPNTGLPSACDDGSPQDQEGHGTWTASLAAGAIGPGTGLIVGVAPAATILNIKVLERLPDPASTAPDLVTRCSTGQAGGLLSWIIQGIEDAIAQHAGIINLSLGTLVDLDTGEGAGLQATFDRVTYTASQAGAVVIASAGNDGLNLANPRYVELPAQARGVLAIVASTNPACAENLTPGAVCMPGPVTLPYYSNYGAPLNAIAVSGGSYPDGPDAGVSGWIRGACSGGLRNTADGPPADSTHSFGCFNLGHAAYVQAMGTSASAALATGAASLLRGANPTWTPDQVIAAMRASATVTPSLPAAPVLNPAALF
jgi:subtilisin family serine protease